MMTSSENRRSRIVVGVDGSACSLLALAEARSIADLTGWSLEAVLAWHFPVDWAPGWAYLPYGTDPQAEAERVLDKAVRAVVGDRGAADVTTTVVQGFPAKVLLERSESAAMLVVGSRGHGGFVGLLLGSVSAKCAEHGKCPVLVVHGSFDEVETLPAAAATSATV